ncbi:Panacea domain-containing protein [Serratia ficaria]|uniref:Panacea domain-containing protein n=1 Tax=Serratia ficaria TaxID=61651 RepID=UPI0021C70866|nr:type II toxin-antitoxin system antitoxin SocA domain-containing protein [Serratia ficaria]
MYNPIQVANKFIELGIAAGKPITQMQAQKLTYIAHGVSLGYRDLALLSDPVCAWRYGPVFPSMYNALKNNGYHPITQPLNAEYYHSSDTDLQPYDETLIRNVFDVYGKYSAEVLSEFTHRTGTPWYQAREAGENIISNNVIANYYKRLINRDPNCIGL